MKARMSNPAIVLPDAVKGILAANKAVKAVDLPEGIEHLLHLRVSQINACGVCVYGGLHAAKKDGETDERLHSVAIWRESPLFTEPERAALALAEAATRISDRPDAVTDEIWDAVAEHFNEEQLSALVIMISMTNMFNRVNAVTKQPAGATW